MTDQQTWVEALNIKPELLAEWSAKAPARKPILVYCIEQGLVDYGEYMRWAQRTYGLAVLQPNYFQATFDASQLDQAKITGAWHPWIFPVETWDNVTFIACVEPPNEPESPEVRYVLADPRAMREAWGGTMTTIRPLKPEDAPPPVPTNLDDAEMPEGLSSTPKPFVLDLENATFNIGAITEVKPATLPIPSEEPVEEEPNFADKTMVSIISTSTLAKEPPPEPAPVAKPAVSKPPELKVVPPVAAPSVASPPVKKTPPPQRTGVTAADEDGAVKTLFANLRERYSASLIMKCSEQNARLYQWDDALQPSSDTSKTTVNLSYPTFMRIVAKTNLPYHGYLVDSPAHHEFFAALGLEKLPVCVTAIPIRFDNFLWGMVVALGEEENQKMEYLNFAQEATEKLMNAVSGSWSKAS